MDNWKVNNNSAVFDNTSNPSVENKNSNLDPSLPSPNVSPLNPGLSSPKAPGLKLGLIIGGAVLGLILIVFLLVVFILPKKTDLIVLVAPETAEISIDGQSYKNGNYKISAGKHTVSISADGFTSSKYDITVKPNDAFTLYDYLEEETGRYSEKDYEILSLIANDDAAISKVNSFRRKMTLFNYLPLLNPETRVYITDQRLNSNCPSGKLCIGITNRGSLSENEALLSIRSAGYDPNDYYLLYETEENYYKETN